MRKHEMICIVCPMSCNLEITQAENGEILEVKRNACIRGDIYARKELTNPTRMLTSTVKITGALYERIPVITSADIPKGKMFEIMKALAHVEVNAPIKINEVIIKDVCGLGVDIVASRSMERIK